MLYAEDGALHGVVRFEKTDRGGTRGKGRQKRGVMPADPLKRLFLQVRTLFEA